jgi:putative methionine-R-sulfoxide reductase with GAF domain
VAKVSTAAAAIRNPKSLLRSVVDLTNYSFKLYHTSIYLLEKTNDNTEILKLAAASGKIGHKMLEEGHFIRFKEQQSKLSQIAHTQDVYITNDLDGSAPKFLGFSYLPKTRNEMIVPMIVADKFVGIFDVKSENPHRFSEDDFRT